MTITILYLDQYFISYMYTHVCMWACWHVYYEGMSDADVALQGEKDWLARSGVLSSYIIHFRHHCRSWNGQALNADFSVLTTFKYHWVLSLTIKWLQNSVEFVFEFESFCIIMKISKLKIIQLSISCTAKGNEILMIW